MPRPKIAVLVSILLPLLIVASRLPAAPTPFPLDGGTLDLNFRNEKYATSPILAVQFDGKVLIGASPIVRLNTDGSVDSTYQLDQAGLGGYIRSAQTLPDNSSLFTVNPINTDTTRLVHVLSDGSIDPTYVQPPAGVRVTSGDYVQLSVPSPYTSLLINRVHADGSAIDSSQVTLQLPGPSDANKADFSTNRILTAFDSQGRLLVAVSNAQPVNATVAVASFTRILRLLPDGSLDSSYPTASINDAITKLVCAPGGGDKLHYYAEWRDGPVGTVTHGKFARLNADGSIDSTYPSMERIKPASSFGASADGSFLLVEADNMVFRYTAEGQVDPHYALRIPDIADPYYRVVLYVNQLIPSPDGRVFASGYLTRPDGPAYMGGSIPYFQCYAPAPHDPATHLANLSVRSSAGNSSATVILGFVVSGQGGQSVLLRNVGPGLGSAVPNHLLDPSLKVYGGSNLLLSVDNWSSVSDPAALANLSAQLGAFPLDPGSKDAATSAQLTGGPYTLHLTATDATNGVGLGEIYDANATPADFDAPRLINLSARAPAGTGSDTLIAGFVITGSNTKNVLIRAVGPTLATQNVTGVIADPQLTLYGVSTDPRAAYRLYNDSRRPIISNDNWGGNPAIQAASAAVGAFALPADSKDAAVLVTLPPGVYTAQVSPATGQPGIALIEVYEVP